MRLSKQRYIYKTKSYTDVCTDFIIWKKATKNTIRNQVPKPYMFSITQCMLEEKIIVYLWVTGLWFFLLSFYFLIFSFCLQWAYIIFTNVLCTWGGGRGKHKVSQQPSSLLIQFQVYGGCRQAEAVRNLTISKWCLVILLATKWMAAHKAIKGNNDPVWWNLVIDEEFIFQTG